MQPHAIITPLKAIRMLLDGSGVLVRAELWAEIQGHYERCQQASSSLERRRPPAAAPGGTSGEGGKLTDG